MIGKVSKAELYHKTKRGNFIESVGLIRRLLHQVFTLALLTIASELPAGDSEFHSYN